MPQVELTDEKLAAVLTKKAALMRLKINPTDCSILAREVMNELIPNQESFKPGDEVVWMHTYDYDKFPPCKGKVVRYPEGAVKVEVEYVSTLWFNKGETVRELIYPNQLRKIAPEDAEAPAPEPDAHSGDVTASEGGDQDSAPQADPPASSEAEIVAPPEAA